MKWYVEHRPQVRRQGKIKLVPIDQLEDKYGFQSVYAYDEATKDRIIAANSTKGLHGCNLYSDTLFMDFDDCGEDAIKFQNYLILHRISHYMFDSGNRSIHFHIPLENPMIGPHIYLIQKAWVVQHAPSADISFYQPAGMYRLEGTYHVKNPGHCKTCLADVSYKTKLDLQVYQPQTVIKMPKILVPCVDTDADFYNMLAHLLQSTQGEGGRNFHAWKIIKTCYQLGWDADRAFQEVSFWNCRNASPSLPESEIIQTLRGVYGSSSQMAAR